MTAVKFYIKISNAQASKVTFNAMSLNHQILKYIVTTCNALEYLDCNCSHIGPYIFHGAPSALSLKTLLISSRVGIHHLHCILSDCPNLERVECHEVESKGLGNPWDCDMAKIRDLTITCVGNAESGIFVVSELFVFQWVESLNSRQDSLLEKIPKIRSLKLHGWAWPDPTTARDLRHMSNLLELDIGRSEIQSCPLLPSSLQCLDLSGNPRLQISNTNQASQTDFELAMLKILHIRDCVGLQPIDVHWLLRASKGKLRLLDAKQSYLSPAQFNFLITEGYFQKISHLCLAGSFIEDETLELIARASPDLEFLDLSSTRITGIGVKALIEANCEKLKYLILINCHSVGPDVVELARARCVRVEYYFPEKGRKRKAIGRIPY